jgi:hypothetical protein
LGPDPALTERRRVEAVFVATRQTFRPSRKSSVADAEGAWFRGKGQKRFISQPAPAPAAVKIAKLQGRLVRSLALALA